MNHAREWAWENCQELHWHQPASQVYYLVERWKMSPPAKLLDLGSGLGRHSLFFAEHGFSVSAIDISIKGALRLQYIALAKRHSFGIYIGDMHSLPYKSDYFDFVLSYHSIHHTDQNGIKQVISELRRVLRSGGEAYLTFLSTQNPKSELGAYRSIDENTIVPLEGTENGIPHYHVDEKRLRNLLDGFTFISLEHIENIWGPKRSSHWFVLVAKE